MPAAALSEKLSQVACTDGTKGDVCGIGSFRWNVSSTQRSGAATIDDVFIDGFAPVVFGDAMQSHPWGEPCYALPIKHAPTLNTIIGSPSVYAGGKLIARIGDKYNSESFDHVISTGSTTVFIG